MFWPPHENLPLNEPTSMKRFTLLVILPLSCFFGLWGSTQWTASAMHYHSALGAPLWVSGDVAFYVPWQFLSWYSAFGRQYPELFNHTSLPAFLGVVGGVLCIAFASMMQKRKQAVPTTYGSSRWSTPEEIAAIGLAANHGVMLGRMEDGKAYIRHDGPEHILAFAPTRSGKGVGLVVPTLLSWTGSALIHDIKGENWALTSGWRSTFSHCMYLNPTSMQSACFNPLLEVRKGDKEVRDVQNIADILVDPDGGNDKRDHWAKTGHALLVGTILHVLYAEEDKTLSGVAQFLSHPDRTIHDTLKLMMETSHLGDRVHPVIASSARELMNKSENELSGVLSTAMSFLGLYRDPVVARTTSRSDFRIADLMQGAYPLSLYLVVPPSDLSRTRPLIRLILNQVGRMLTESMEFGLEKNYHHRLLMMIDEFPSLGRLDFFETSLAYIAGYGIKAFLIAQSLNQLDKHYTASNAILDNCHIRVCYASNDDRTAKRISNLLGEATVIKQQESFSGNRSAFRLNHKSIADQEVGRPLLTSGEISTLPPTDEIILVSGMHPIHAKKIRYYEDSNFTARVRPPPMLSTEGGYSDKPPIRPHDWAYVHKWHHVMEMDSANTPVTMPPIETEEEEEAIPL